MDAVVSDPTADVVPHTRIRRAVVGAVDVEGGLDLRREQSVRQVDGEMSVTREGRAVDRIHLRVGQECDGGRRRIAGTGHAGHDADLDAVSRLHSDPRHHLHGVAVRGDARVIAAPPVRLADVGAVDPDHDAVGGLLQFARHRDGEPPLRRRDGDGVLRCGEERRDAGVPGGGGMQPLPGGAGSGVDDPRRCGADPVAGEVVPDVAVGEARRGSPGGDGVGEAVRHAVHRLPLGRGPEGAGRRSVEEPRIADDLERCVRRERRGARIERIELRGERREQC